MFLRTIAIAFVTALSVTACQKVPDKAPDKAPEPAAESASSLAASTPAATTATWIVTADGVGPLKIGMTAAEVEKAVGAKVNLNSEASGDESACAQAEVPGHQGLFMLFMDGRLNSLSLFEPATARTAKAIGIGSTEDEVRAAYEGLEITGRAYYEQKDAARELTIWAEKDRSGIRFLTDNDRRVDSIRAGGESMTWMEGCA